MKTKKNLDPINIFTDRLKVFNSICDDYNVGRLTPGDPNFEPMTDSYLEALQRMTWNAFELFKLLHKWEPCDATSKYLIFCGKIMLRLSYLRGQNRKETDAETGAYFSDFKTKYGLYCSIEL